MRRSGGIRWVSGGAVVASLASSAFWLACGSDDTSAVTCTGDSCVAEAGLTDTSDDEQHVPDGCDLTKDPKDSAACVDDTIALFVSAAGSDANPGTKSAPLKTIGAAVGKTDSQHTRVYVCAGAYGENVKIATGNKTQGIYAGFSCGDWSYAGGAPNAIVTSNGGYALEVNTLNTTLTVEDVELDSPDATNPGDSSIAVFITQSTGVILKRVNAKAGKGADGVEGLAADTDAGATPIGNSGTSNSGGLLCTNTCPNGVSTGGKGGTGADNGATPGGGQDGGPAIPANPPGADGTGGAGKMVGCNPGTPGAKAGAADGGASGAEAGTLAVDGWHAGAGAAGYLGGVGQGGGGGSGGVNTADGDNKGGGGGGGCGGCGGAGGSVGGSGGSSFAILVFQSTVTVDACGLTSSGGGMGKQGGLGQNGLGGGSRGEATSGGNGCPGAAGGAGGAGAGGGGGAAGNSIALGYVGTQPTVQGSTFTKGSAGTPGGGGTGAAGNDGLPGADGISAEQQDLKP